MNHNKEARVTDVIWRNNWQGTVVRAKHHIWIISQIFLDNISLLNSKMGSGKFSFIGYLDPLIIVTDCQKDNLIFIIIVFIPVWNIRIINKLVFLPWQGELDMACYLNIWIPVNLKGSVKVHFINKSRLGNKFIMVRVVCSPVMDANEDDFLL